MGTLGAVIPGPPRTRPTVEAALDVDAVCGNVVEPTPDSVSELSGVVWWLVCVLKLGLNKLVRLGEGGRGVGGRL